MSENPYGGVDSYAVSYTSYKARVLLRTPHFNKDDLEDIKQELMLAYLLAWPGFDPSKGHPKSFIKTVINNRAAEMLRELEAQKRWSGVKNVSLSTSGTDENQDDWVERIESDAGLWGDVFRSVRHDIVERALDIQKMRLCLPDDLKATFDLLLEYSVTEAAEILGIPRTTMSSRLKKLRKFMEEHEGEK